MGVEFNDVMISSFIFRAVCFPSIQFYLKIETLISACIRKYVVECGKYFSFCLYKRGGRMLRCQLQNTD